jgi:hypothetical protein
VERLADVNDRDLLGAIRLGCEAMGRVFDGDDPRDVAFFEAVVLPEPRLAFSDVHSEAHVPGRHLNALLAAEGLAGVPADDVVIRRHRAALLYSFSGDRPLPLNRSRIDGALTNFCQHNVREGLHGLAALIRWRGDDEAREIALRSVAFIDAHWRASDNWSTPISPPDCAGLTLAQGLGRAIGPLVKLHLATGEQAPLDLARRVAAALAPDFPTDGAYRPERLGTHVHSVTSSLSSLAQLAEIDQDGALFERVRAFVDNGLWQLRDAIGWVIEIAGPESNPDKGEGNSSGDIVETDLILSRHGVAGAADDADRIVRAHLLPSQLRDISWIPVSTGITDGTTDVAERLRGTWGMPAPYGHRPVGLETIKFNLDIVGGVVASLAEVSGVWSPDEPANAPIREMELRHRTRTIAVRLAGNTVVAMEDVGAEGRFFPVM